MINICNLWKTYKTRAVLQGLSLKVKRGETLVILGRSGVGKSVLLKHIIGICVADRGYIEVDGVRISDLKEEKRLKITNNMGMLFQGSALFDSMNTEENVAFFLKQHGDIKKGVRYANSEISDMVDHALKMVDLSGTQKQMPSDLSGGMRKRVGFARMIVYRPEYLLYDEPTAGLDPITAMQINELIVKVQQELKATSIVVTHDIISSLYVGDRLALQKDGKIAYIDTPDKFLQIEDSIIAFLRQTVSRDPRTFRRKQNG